MRGHPIAALAALLATSHPPARKPPRPGVSPTWVRAERVGAGLHEPGARALQESGWSFDGQLALEWNDAATIQPSSPRTWRAGRSWPAGPISRATENMPNEALMKATQKLPIVVMGPTNLHHVLDAQLRPLANVTGVSLGLEQTSMRSPVEVLLQAFPTARRIGMMEKRPTRTQRAGDRLIHGHGEADRRRVGAREIQARPAFASAWDELADAGSMPCDPAGYLGVFASTRARRSAWACRRSYQLLVRHAMAARFSYGAAGRVNTCGRGARIDLARGSPAGRELLIEELRTKRRWSSTRRRPASGVTPLPAIARRPPDPARRAHAGAQS